MYAHGENSEEASEGLSTQRFVVLEKCEVIERVVMLLQ